jgi:hypothetical protein
MLVDVALQGVLGGGGEGQCLVTSKDVTSYLTCSGLIVGTDHDRIGADMMKLWS